MSSVCYNQACDKPGGPLRVLHGNERLSKEGGHIHERDYPFSRKRTAS